jgi:hypothetical protein
MARSITLTLGAGLGADLGPNFNLTTNVGSVTPSTATRTELLAGKSVSVDDLATQVTITSTGTCTNAITQIIPCATTTTTSTSTSTSTTTTEPPTTTTTTEAPTEANISLSNSSLDIVITDVKVNGVSVTSSSFPLYTGNGGFATTSQIGTYNVDVYYSSAISGQNITIFDEIDVQCQTTGGAGGTIVTFSSIVLSTTNSLSITISDGVCS